MSAFCKRASRPNTADLGADTSVNEDTAVAGAELDDDSVSVEKEREAACHLGLLRCGGCAAAEAVSGWRSRWRVALLASWLAGHEHWCSTYTSI